MQIREMFKKSITRDIQGVVIAGQGEKNNIATELEEYVVTRELQRHFADFFAAYKKGIQGTTPKMGVWISGFFGSGKSHFLKIPALTILLFLKHLLCSAFFLLHQFIFDCMFIYLKYPFSNDSYFLAVLLNFIILYTN